MCGRRRSLPHISLVDVDPISKEEEILHFHQLSASTRKPCGSEPHLPHVYRENTIVSNASNPTATTTRKTGGFMRAAARDDIQVALRQSCAQGLISRHYMTCASITTSSSVLSGQHGALLSCIGAYFARGSLIDRPPTIIYRCMSLDDPTDAHGDRSRSRLAPPATDPPEVEM